MARRKGSGGRVSVLLIGGAAAVILFPKEVWILLICVALIGLVVWGTVVLSNRAQTAPAPPEPPAPRGKPPALPRSAPQATWSMQEPVVVRPAPVHPTSADRGSPISRPSEPRWVPFGESVSIRGQDIAGGGFYLGMPRGYLDSNRPLVDPTLPFSRYTDWPGAGMGYWPRYETINQNERGTYLTFLASSRDAPEVGLGYVFLYFYGLEYRLLRAIPAGVHGLEEGHQILEEVERLQAHYGHNRSFRNYSARLLAIGRIKLGLIDTTPSAEQEWDSPQQHRVAQIVASQLPIPADMAFLWGRALTEGALSSTWDVVREELQSRFAQLYGAKFGDGLVIKAGKSKLALTYRWAAPGQGVDTFETDLPDITRSKAPVRPLTELVQQAMGELENLRRVRRSKSCTPSAELAAMPEALRGQNVPETFRDLVQELDGLLNVGVFADVATTRLIQGCGMPVPDRLGKREITNVINALEALGYALEPDVRFHGHPPALNGQVVVFRILDDAARTPTAAYAAALLMLQAALAVAGQDSEILQSEMEVAVEAIERQFALPDSERRRIEAHLRWLRNNPISLAKLDNRVRQLPEPEREAFAGVLLEIATADGHVAAAEVRVVERFYKALGLDPARVPADLHHASTGGRPRTNASGALNADVIAQKLAETGRVQSVLAQIFNEAESPDREATVTADTTSVGPNSAELASPAPQASAIPGLDTEHLSLLRLTLNHDGDQWERSSFEAACEALGILPDGAAEVLNEAAFELAGEALIEGDDPLYLNDYVREQFAQNLTNQNKVSA